MVRLMVQGDRDASGIESTVRKLGEICKERGIGLNVGEAGEIVRILAESDADTRLHTAKEHRPHTGTRDNYVSVDCRLAAGAAKNMLIAVSDDGVSKDQPQITYDRLAWGIRLVTMIESSQGFIFFHGREGTLAHLIPVMAFIKKGEVDKGVTRPRRVALIEWPMGSARPIFELMGISSDSNLLREFFGGNATERAVNWLTDGLPA